PSSKRRLSPRPRRLGLRLLEGIDGVDRRRIGEAAVTELPFAVRRIGRAVEDVGQMAKAHLAGIEGDLDHFTVSALRIGFVSGSLAGAARIAGYRLDDALHPVEIRFD